MNKICVCICLLGICALTAGCGKISEPELTPLYYRYFLTLPDNYSQSNEYPLILAMHGYHGNATDRASFNAYGLGQYADSTEGFQFIVAAPQTEEQYDISVVWQLVRDLIRDYAVDANRIYVTGFSMGGGYAYDLAVAHADSVAAVVPIAAYSDTRYAEYLKDMGVWIFHDENDPVVPYTYAFDMYNALRAVGCDVKLTSYDTGIHTGWYEAYTNPDLYDWLLEFSTEDR